jgi:hypothetical protein
MNTNTNFSEAHWADMFVDTILEKRISGPSLTDIFLRKKVSI